MGSQRVSRLTAALGGVVFALAGALMGARNAGWFGLAPDADQLFPFMGAGVALLAAGWIGSGLARTIWGSGLLGRLASVLLTVGGLLFLAQPLFQFAILGTLSFGLGLVVLAVALFVHRLLTLADRLLVTLAAVASLTWNTETLSAFLLVGVGLLLAALSLGLDRQRVVT